MGQRAIIHINVADFAVAVERLTDPRLRGRPVIVAPAGTARATVYDMSEEAFRSGVQKGMPLVRALCRCRDAVVLPPRPDRYERAASALLKQARRYSPRVEMTDVQGHLFIDATGTGRLFGPPPDVAVRLRRAIRDQVGVAPVWSVASNRLVAKVATRVVKPDGECVVRFGDEAAFLAPLPVFLLPGLNAEAIRRLAEFNLTQAGQVADLTPAQLSVIVAGFSQRLYETVRGIDPSPVAAGDASSPSLRLEHIFADDTNAVAPVESALYTLIERAGARLRRHRRCARRAAVTLDYSDGGRVVRQATLTPAGCTDPALFDAARTALSRAWTRRVRIRRLTVVLDRLVPPPAQLSLFDPDRTEARRAERLAHALDAVRARFGDEAVKMGRTLAAAPPAGAPRVQDPERWQWETSAGMNRGQPQGIAPTAVPPANAIGCCDAPACKGALYGRPGSKTRNDGNGKRPWG